MGFDPVNLPSQSPRKQSRAPTPKTADPNQSNRDLLPRCPLQKPAEFWGSPGKKVNTTRCSGGNAVRTGFLFCHFSGRSLSAGKVQATFFLVPRLRGDTRMWRRWRERTRNAVEEMGRRNADLSRGCSIGVDRRESNSSRRADLFNNHPVSSPNRIP